MLPLEKSPKINKRTLMFIPESRVVLLPIIKLVYFAPFFHLNLEVKFLHNYCLKGQVTWVKILTWMLFLGFRSNYCPPKKWKIAVCFCLSENKLLMLRISLVFWQTHQLASSLKNQFLFLNQVLWKLYIISF
jgi:hypothetical protein